MVKTGVELLWRQWNARGGRGDLQNLVGSYDLRVAVIPNQSIAMTSVTEWHQFGNDFSVMSHKAPGELVGWHHVDGRYQSFWLHRPEYAALCERKVYQAWECDLQELHGFSNSKSDLESFHSTDAMVERDSPDLIGLISHKAFAELLMHKDIGIIHSPGSDYFVRYRWDGKIYLSNNDGSHHLAAAKYVAARIGTRLKLKGAMHEYGISVAAIRALTDDYEMFVLPSGHRFIYDLQNTMERCRAAWLCHKMPSPYEHHGAMLLPRYDARSMMVAEAFRSNGATDLGELLIAAAG